MAERWQYKFQTARADAVQDVLDRAGEEGWDLVASHYMATPGSGNTVHHSFAMFFRAPESLGEE